MAVRQVISVNGRVQGVGFRATTRAIARDHPVAGWVRNEPDGSVTIDVEGDAEAVKSFVAAIHARMSRNISAMNALEATPTGAQGFEIRH
ncbi:MAG: acylphosphatase [Phycisphaerales bacterium]